MGIDHKIVQRLADKAAALVKKEGLSIKEAAGAQYRTGDHFNFTEWLKLKEAIVEELRQRKKLKKAERRRRERPVKNDQLKLQL